jgi:Lipocalin-like domain
MKKFTYAFLMLAFGIMLLSSCKKTEEVVTPPPTSVVVGNWKLDRIVLSELPITYASLNGKSLDPLQNFGIVSTYNFVSDNTFTNKETFNGVIDDYKGTWVLTNNQLKITYSDKTTDDFAYDETTKYLSLASFTSTISLTNPTTNTSEKVACKYQLVYVKQ